MKVHKLEMLKDVLPLSHPLTLMIDPTNKCNFKCVFCATGDKKLLSTAPQRPLQHMPLDLFKKIIDDAEAFLPNKIKRIHLFKDGEPFLNPNIIKMIKYVKKSKVVQEVDVTTNASLIDINMADQIVLSGLDTIRISFEGSISNEKYKIFTKTKYTYDDIKNSLINVYNSKRKYKSNSPYIEAKVVDTGLNVEEKKKFKNDFEKYASEITFDAMIDRKKLTAKVIKGKKKQPKLKVCPIPFYNLSVNCDGSVSSCCYDWNHSTLVGDLNNESLFEVWNGSKLNEFRKMHAEFRKKEHPTCSKCVATESYAQESNIDSLALNDKEKLYS